ncbi:hypothetical protein [Sporohalobacter salinus]|uniref:hypothetical protein n=1 Tax=Sporohalobacter salinus TaxID=1494606 RepID=UPI00195FA61F|nr:hypothetical protein [Sporohalobacter salinus]MBM7623775.1 hypothetical protein [Sporohalobacter salinus]
MKKLTRVLIKILAIYIFFRFMFFEASFFWAIINLPRSKTSNYILFSNIIANFSVLVLAILLWFYSKNIASYIVKDDENILLESIEIKDLQAAGIFVVGIGLISISITDLLRNIFLLLDENIFSDLIINIYLPKLIKITAKIIIGIWFVLKNIEIINRISKLNSILRGNKEI